MRRTFTFIAVAVFLATTLLAQSPSDPPMLGFSSASAAKERTLESQFDSSLKRDDLRDWLKRLSARPHHLGSAYDKDNAEFIAALFKGWGYDTKIEEFRVLFPTPKRRVVELIAPEHFTAKLLEPPGPGGATSGQQNEKLPVDNPYPLDVDVTRGLV